MFNVLLRINCPKFIQPKMENRSYFHCSKLLSEQLHLFNDRMKQIFYNINVNCLSLKHFASQCQKKIETWQFAAQFTVSRVAMFQANTIPVSFEEKKVSISSRTIQNSERKMKQKEKIKIKIKIEVASHFTLRRNIYLLSHVPLNTALEPYNGKNKPGSHYNLLSIRILFYVFIKNLPVCGNNENEATTIHSSGYCHNSQQ